MLGIERMLKGITAATTAELINKADTITDEGGTVKDDFFQNGIGGFTTLRELFPRFPLIPSTLPDFL